MTIIDKYKSLFHNANSVLLAARQELYTNFQKSGLLPETLSLLVNDICNSRCQMCNIWKMKQDKEITPADLGIILGDPLFKRLQYIGVSGGEPTLRKDLPDIFRIIATKRPRLKGTGIITNAINTKDVISRVEQAALICAEENVPFNVMVSLDGIGPIHDLVRGRKGNFNSALQVIRYFRDTTPLPISIGCTITKDNMWYVDEVLDFCKEEGVYGRFRIAEFIRRLYNDQADRIRNFSEDEAYHLGLFFMKLEFTYEQNPVIQKTYRNIRSMLMENTPRTIGCPGQSLAVTLDCRGQLLYCAPKSPVLGDALKESAHLLYLDGLPERERIIQNDCSDCIHDYHDQLTIKDWQRHISSKLWRRRLSLRTAITAAKGLSGISKTDSSVGKYLIVGWYGTETAGDKAILAELLHRIYTESPSAEVTLVSLYPAYSQQTLNELGYKKVHIISAYSKEYLVHAAQTNEIIMGGGPLMHIQELGIVLWGFIQAKRHGRRTKIAGCGIGPLTRGDIFVQGVREIIRLTDYIELRDFGSVSEAKKLIDRDDIVCSGDYAVGYVERWKKSKQNGSKGDFINLYLRQWPHEYQGNLGDVEFLSIRQKFENQLGLFISDLCARMGVRPRLLAMHHFCIGGDDRDFNRAFAAKHLTELDPVLELKPFSLDEILQSMLESQLLLCMRFHSVLFAELLGTNYLAIDYTNGGKIANFLRDCKQTSRLLSVQDIASGNWNNRLSKLGGHKNTG